MSGNLTADTTIFKSALQAKIDLVDSSTPVEDMAAYVRAGELIDGMDNTPISTELQLRLDSVTSSTDIEEINDLAVTLGKLTNTLPALIEGSGGGGGFKVTTLGVSQSYVLSSATSPLILTPPSGKSIRLDSLFLNNAADDLDTVSVLDGSDVIISGILAFNATTLGSFSIGKPSYASDASNFAANSSVKDSIVSGEIDKSISIECTDPTPKTVYYSVSYGDL